MNQSGDQLVFLKLGGSLITDKHTPRSARREVINRIAQEITNALQTNTELQIVLGHRSGAFGHMSWQKLVTIHGVDALEGW